MHLNVELISIRFSTNRKLLIADKLLPCLQDGFLSSVENVINIVNPKMTLGVFMVGSEM